MKNYNNFINESYFDSYSGIIREYISRKLSKNTEYRVSGMTISELKETLYSLRLDFKEEDGNYNYFGLTTRLSHNTNSSITDIDYMIHSLNNLKVLLKKYDIIHEELINGERLIVIIKLDNKLINLAKSLSTNDKFNL